jgi:hypothetical protein
MAYSSDYVRLNPDRSRSRGDPPEYRLPIWRSQQYCQVDVAILNIATHGMMFHHHGNLAGS